MLGVLVFCHLTALGGVISGMNNSTGVLNKVMGKRLPISWPRIEKNIGFQMCLRKCEAMSYCLSINFNRVLLECELNEWKKNDTNDLVDDGNYFYTEIVVSRMNTITVVCLKIVLFMLKYLFNKPVNQKQYHI